MSNDSEVLISNLDKIHTTEMGLERIRRNLYLDKDDIIEWCKQSIKNSSSCIIRKGKNWYISIDNYIITVNAHSYTIITAHKLNYSNQKDDNVIINERPNLDKKLDSKTFKNFYYLKEELIEFCKKNNLQTIGGKLELTDKIAHYLDTGEKTFKIYNNRKAKIINNITLDMTIEDNFVCSEKHRAFYKEQIGSKFSFNVTFQKWLKSNTGKTYKDSIEAYYKILEDSKKIKTTIDKQFEYNTYTRDFFNDNNDKNLAQAIKCWKYKKSLRGHNKYEKSDLQVLKGS